MQHVPTVDTYSTRCFVTVATIAADSWAGGSGRFQEGEKLSWG